MSNKSRGPYLPNMEAYVAAGLNPATGLPYKMGGNDVQTKIDIKRALRIVDEQDAVNRFTWYNLPDGLTSQLLERILYYRGQGAFFKMNDKFYFLPYALDGTIDVYGRFNSITPLPFNGTTQTKDEKPLIKGLTYDCVYEVMTPEDFVKQDGTFDITKMEDLVDKSAVILKDYTEQISQTNTSRQVLNEPILDIMSDCLPFCRTALFHSTGVKGMRVGSQVEANEVITANRAINNAALTGQWAVPIVGAVDFQDLTNGNGVGKSEEFLLSLQAFDSFRLSLYGLPNGGLFQKKAHMLEAEQNMNAGTASLVLQDSLSNRQAFCNIVNSIWGLGIWCDVNESITQMDRDMDGDAYGNGEETKAQNAAAPQNNEGGTNDDTV